MKIGIAILATLVVFLSPVYGTESDVVRVFDEKLRLTEQQVSEYLKQADLENHRFERSVEESSEKDKNGKTTKRKTIYYRVTDDCDRAIFWAGVLEQRLPEKLKNLKIVLTAVREVESRIIGRKTKRCTIGLEIHPNRCLYEISGKNKRGMARGLCGCFICWRADIFYEK